MAVKTPMTLRAIGLGLFATLATAAAAGSAPGASDMRVLQRWKLGGAGGWDYLTSMHRVSICF